MTVRPLSTRPTGYPSREAAEREVDYPDNPVVRRIAQLADGSYAVEWANGKVTDTRGLVEHPEWAPEPVVAVVFVLNDRVRRAVALARPCVRELASDDEVRTWLVGAVERVLVEEASR